MAAGGILSVYFYYGEEEFNIEQAIGKLKKQLAPEFLQMSYKTSDNPKFAELVAVFRSQPMMFGKMLIVVDISNYFGKTLEDSEIAEITAALDDCGENVDIVLTATDKPDARKKFFKTLAKYNAQEFAKIPTYKTAELAAWIQKRGVKLAPGAANTLIAQVGNNLRQLASELEKLLVFAHPKDAVTEDMVREICVNNEDLFAFSDLLMEDKRDLALLEYRRLLDKSHPMQITAVLQKQIRSWIELKTGGDAGMHEYRAKLTRQRLANTPLTRLVALKKNLTDAEYRIKNGEVGDVEAEIENAIIFKPG